MFLTEGIETKEEGTQDGKFYLSLGEALQRLGKMDQALKVIFLHSSILILKA